MNFLKRQSRSPAPRGAAISFTKFLIERGRDDRGAEPLKAVQFRVATEFDSVGCIGWLFARLRRCTFRSAIRYAADDWIAPMSASDLVSDVQSGDSKSAASQQ
jgi:hypothetical protein